MIIGNPNPMPDHTNDREHEKLYNEIIELAPGDRFVDCEFDNCEFVGVGPFEFLGCLIRSKEGFSPVDHAHIKYCTVWGKE